MHRPILPAAFALSLTVLHMTACSPDHPSASAPTSPPRAASCSSVDGGVRITSADWYPTDVPGTPTPDPAGQKLLAQLEHAYAARSAQEAERFFRVWSAAARHRSTADLAAMHPTVRAAYEVFERIYTPTDHTSLGASEFGPDMYGGVPYVVAPGRMMALCYAELPSPGIEEAAQARPTVFVTIHDFRPLVSAPGAEVVYLTPDYEWALNTFLGSEFSPLGSGGSIMNPAAARDESWARLQFLAPYIRIVPGHWGGYWYLVSHPDIGQIMLNEHLTHADAPYQIGYQGGDAVLDRGPDQAWILRSAGLSWIE
jgi:hypothetical protein